MIVVPLLVGSILFSVCARGEEVRPKSLERPEAALDAAGSENLKRVVRENELQPTFLDDAQALQDTRRTPRQDDIFYPIPRTHHLHHHLLNPVAPPPIPQPSTWPIRPPIPPPPVYPQIPCNPPSTTSINEGHFAIPHVPSSYSAALPYISGYRLIPVIGHKHIVVNDVAHIPGPGPCVDGTYPQMSYVQQSYSSGREAEDFLKPFEQAGFFALPPDPEHQLKSAKEYQGRIDELHDHVEHLESMRDNAATLASRS